MKSLMIFAIMTLTIFVNAQTKTDFMGMPNENNNDIAYNNLKFNGEEVPVQPATPIMAFPSPLTLPSGIAWDGSKLWLCGYNEYKLYCLSAVDGSILNEYPTTIRRPYGITYYNDQLYILNNENKIVYVMDMNANVVDSIELLNYSNMIFPTGLCVTEDGFWLNDTKGSTAGSQGDSTYMFDFESNNISDFFPAFGDFSTGIAIHDDYMYINDNFSQTTFKITIEDHQIVDRFSAPGGAYPNGLAWGNDGLWYVNNASDSIYFVSQTTTSSANVNATEVNIVYPNPASDVIYFQAPAAKNLMNCEIMDINGKVVLEASNAASADVSRLNNGIYFVRFSNGLSQKILISR